MKPCGAYTLTEGTERYCIDQGNDERKGFENLLIHAADTWNETLRSTLWSFSSVWLRVHEDGPFPYIKLPKNMSNFLGLYQLDNCGRLIPVHRSASYNILPKPAKKACGCEACDCGDLCAQANSFSLTTKDVIGGTEKEWLETCKNGDVIRWREVPAKKEDGTFETIIDSERVCTLQTKSCGCVEDSEANRKLLFESCGCRFSVCHSRGLFTRQDSACETTLQSDGCGKIFLIGKYIQDYYLLQFQESEASKNSLVPEYGLMTLKAGIDFHCVAFNPKRKNERTDAERFYTKQINNMVMYLNPIDLEFINRLQSQPRILP
jgi:hypothetical protein